VSPLRLVTAFLLAGAASGCSSDVTRFDGLFSKTDTVTTNSVPHRANEVNGKLPVPRANVRNGDESLNSDVSGDQALNQPYPGDTISTSTVSDARASVTPIRVQRTELSTPSVRVQEKVAVAQPFPAKVKVKMVVNADADQITTGTVRSAWKITDRSPRVEIKSGQTLSGISVRYGVPQAEILRANNMKSAADLKYGKQLVIPVSVKADMKAKAIPAELAVNGKKKVPTPANTPEDKAILTNTASRDKSRKTESDKLADNGKNNEGESYTVKSGDSLAKIAKANKVSVDALKQANGMTTASIRIGQKLAIPGADNIKTASIPKDSAVKNVAEAKPKTYTPPVAEKSVSEVQRTADNGEDAPDATGIGKYRWPVRGAVIAGYGQNVEGTRNTGIDISVPEGTAVKAAENGVVIYSGSGLKDLGNTVLIRHDDGTVTVYGNTASLSVKRGDKVTRGQVVASSGMTGAAKRPKLHFEVRQNAVAVNPMTFLQ
jgi:murein DD-endopeptidase MepM/ murein hydrolase activator NlpD